MGEVMNKTQRSTMRLQATFSFFIFLQLFHFFTLLVAPSSSSLLPPCPSFLLAPPSSLFLLPPSSSFFLVQHCLNHLESIKGHFSSILTKASRTNGRTNGRTDKASYRDARTHLIIMFTRTPPSHVLTWSEMFFCAC